MANKEAAARRREGEERKRGSESRTKLAKRKEAQGVLSGRIQKLPKNHSDEPVEPESIEPLPKQHPWLGAKREPLPAFYTRFNSRNLGLPKDELDEAPAAACCRLLPEHFSGGFHGNNRRVDQQPTTMQIVGRLYDNRLCQYGNRSTLLGPLITRPPVCFSDLRPA